MIMTRLYLLFVALAVACTPLRHVSAQSGDSNARETPSDVETLSGDGDVTPDPPKASETEPGSHYSNCALTTTDVILERHGCTGRYASISCTGLCETSETPNYFMSRQETTGEVFLSRCKCCSKTGFALWSNNSVTLTCPDQTNMTVHHRHLIPLDCTCLICG